MNSPTSLTDEDRAAIAAAGVRELDVQIEQTELKLRSLLAARAALLDGRREGATQTAGRSAEE